MTTAAQITNAPLPENTDLLNAQSTFGGYASAVDGILVPRFATTTARDTAFASGATAGQLCVVTNSGTFAELMIYDGATWQFVGPPLEGRATSATTSAATTTPVNVPGLSVSVRANCIYEVEANIFVSSAVSNGGLTFSLSVPAGCSGNWGALGQTRSPAGAFQAATTVLANPITSGIPVGTQTVGANGVAYAFFKGILVVGSTAGTVQGQIASRNGTSSVNIHSDSNLKLTRIA